MTMPKSRLTVAFLIFAIALFSTMLARAASDAGAAAPRAGEARLAGLSTVAAAKVEAAGEGGRVARGEYLVWFGGCNDCHTPWKLGPKGPEQDFSRRLSGHPADLKMPPAPALPPGPWAMNASGTMTAWSGPWGVSFTANLTPDKETGLGDWTEEMFIATMKTGRHQGKGRPLLPPMPYFNLQKLTDEDIKSVFAYLQSLPAIRNKVPAPIDPEEPVQ
jgi:mono/diheme cytochrome c family protein